MRISELSRSPSNEPRHADDRCSLQLLAVCLQGFNKLEMSPAVEQLVHGDELKLLFGGKPTHFPLLEHSEYMLSLCGSAHVGVGQGATWTNLVSHLQGPKVMCLQVVPCEKNFGSGIFLSSGVRRSDSRHAPESVPEFTKLTFKTPQCFRALRM